MPLRSYSSLGGSIGLIGEEIKMNSLSKIITAGTLALSIVGCDPEPTIRMKDEGETKVELQTDCKYEIKRVAVFEDNLSYNGKRGVYEVIDKKTGQTYLGISGIGITERASHSAGKSTVQDER